MKERLSRHCDIRGGRYGLGRRDDVRFGLCLRSRAPSNEPARGCCSKGWTSGSVAHNEKTGASGRRVDTDGVEVGSNFVDGGAMVEVADNEGVFGDVGDNIAGVDGEPGAEG